MCAWCIAATIVSACALSSSLTLHVHHFSKNAALKKTLQLVEISKGTRSTKR